MRKLLIASAFLLASYGTYAQSAEDMQAYTDYGTPGAMHQMLAKDNGVWDEEITMWMAPGTEPMKYTATVTNEMIMGNHYQQSKHSGSMMGMPFEGLSITGYDNARKVFVNSWVDNFATGIMNSDGTWNEKTKSIEYKGLVTDPVSKKQIPFRQIMYYIDDNTQRMEMFMTHKGKEYKSMEIKFKRK